jgi:surface protein
MKKLAVGLALLAAAGLTARGGTFDVVVQTTKPNETFTVKGEWYYNFAIDWGDGTSAGGALLHGATSHVYAAAGTYTNHIGGTTAMRVYFGGDAGTTPHLLRDIVSPMSDGFTKVTSAYRMFAGATNITQFTQADWFDGVSTNVTNMTEMFLNCKRFNQDLSGWSVGNVTEMSYMFSGAGAFNGDIGGWDVGKVTKMSEMFKNAGAFNRDIGGWNVGKVTSMAGMFSGAGAFDQGIGGWAVSNVASTAWMFAGAEKFNQDIGGWNVGKVTAMEGMFSSAKAFNQDLGGWNVGKVTAMQNMFERNAVFNQDIGNWDVGNVTDMRAMFYQAAAFKQDISRWNVASVAKFNSFLLDTSLPVEFYDRLLIRWSRLPLKTGLVFHGGSSKYDLGLPAAARQRLTDAAVFGWSITDGGTTGRLYAEAATRILVR